MSSARDIILKRVRDAQRCGYVPQGRQGIADRVDEPPSRESLIQRFETELTALGGEFIRCPSKQDVNARLLSLLSEHSFVSWEPDQLPYPELDGFARRVPSDSSREELERVAFGITGVQAAIAETGSLMLVATMGRPRFISLLPPHHIAVVREDQLVHRLADALVTLPDSLPSNVTVITGPSRTADIELSLTMGVHGPGALTVILGPSST